MSERIVAAGRRIEEESLAIIDREAGAHGFPPRAWPVVRRVIHATADFEFQRTLELHPDAVEAGVAALRARAAIVADVRMIAAGLPRLEVRCLIGDAEVAAAAREGGTTRAAAAMRKASRLGLLDGGVVAIGNAPTALAELQRLVEAGVASPALVVAVPVGFVGAAESKEAARSLPVPWIVARGRKGGTPVAVAVLNALAILAAEDDA
ncbi:MULTISPECIES: precorrin-8X methylmutase [Anaeromyxobacter]|uniref:precorrin-8X methylmutase n=1 Tax=Anaeromyxobacter TaxID=161492 RepID=UPI001F56DEFF|nr:MULTISPECIES: precorrin-8X methylmutase [unclassified Anaeromyxobacter]